MREVSQVFNRSGNWGTGRLSNLFMVIQAGKWRKQVLNPGHPDSGEPLPVYQGGGKRWQGWTPRDFRARLAWPPCFVKEETVTKDDQMICPRPPGCLMHDHDKNTSFFLFSPSPSPKVISVGSGGDERFHIFTQRGIQP